MVKMAVVVVATVADGRGGMRGRGSRRGVWGGRGAVRVGGMVSRVGQDTFSDDGCIDIEFKVVIICEALVLVILDQWTHCKQVI